MIKIIHISDFHLESSTPPLLKTRLIDALALDLSNYVDENTIVVITGDLIDKGGKQFDKTTTNPFKEFETIFIKNILRHYPVLKNRIFIVPGNHDIYREKLDAIVDDGLRSNLKNEVDVTNLITTHRHDGKYLERLHDYKAWEKQFYSSYSNFDYSYFDNSAILNIGGNKVGISMLNSSWLCKNDEDKGKLLVGKEQIESSLKKIQSCDIKICLMHHPIEFLKETDEYGKVFDQAIIKNLLYNHYDLLLVGHVHQLDLTYIQNLQGNIFISIANSTIADFSTERAHVNGYSILNFYPQNKTQVHFRKYIEHANRFVPNTDVGTDNGVKEFVTLSPENLTKYNQAINTIEKLKNYYTEKLNEHLITYNSDSKATCSIEKMFVEPTISNYPGGFKYEDVTNYTVDNILQGDSNFLIHGLKESGKTILLDKMFLDALNNYSTLNKIPVLLKFSNLKNKDIDKTIRDFLALKTTEVKDLLKEFNFILFIDDIDFSDKYTFQLDKLKTFLQEYPKVQIVATSEIEIENEIPTKYLDYNNVFKFEVGFIQNLSSKQIKNLITKWFEGKEIDFHENLQKLIRNFADLGLPKTPLSVTMFLWIIEKQERKPINNSVLVELFLDNLLEKANFENIYNETFDFKNKQRLLSCIAKFMHDEGDEEDDYSVEYTELLKFITDYLKSRFTGNAKSILDDIFIRRGIVTIEDESKIKFKSAFFFHYFLALHFDIDPTFKAYVFSEDNYVHYMEEIVYYSGLKRDDVSVLKFTQEKLTKTFEFIVPKLDEQYERIDKTLETKSAITEHLDFDRVKAKPSEEQLEKKYDDQLSEIPVKKIIESKHTASGKKQLGLDRLLKLACEVLKNSEDVDDVDLKKKSYENVLKSSIGFFILYRDFLLGYYKKHKTEPKFFPQNIDFNIFIRLMPLIHQSVINQWVGTPKLKPIILQKVKQDSSTINISDLERFLSVFIYTDLRGSNYTDVLNDFIKKEEYHYLLDLSFIKIMSYYHLRSKNDESDKFYLKQMADIKEKLKLIRPNKKNQFMEDMKKKKKLDNN